MRKSRGYLMRKRSVTVDTAAIAKHDPHQLGILKEEGKDDEKLVTYILTKETAVDVHTFVS